MTGLCARKQRRKCGFKQGREAKKRSNGAGGRAGWAGGRVGRSASGRSGGVEVADWCGDSMVFLAMPPDLAVHAV